MTLESVWLEDVESKEGRMYGGAVGPSVAEREVVALAGDGDVGRVGADVSPARRYSLQIVERDGSSSGDGWIANGSTRVRRWSGTGSGPGGLVGLTLVLTTSATPERTLRTSAVQAPGPARAAR